MLTLIVILIGYAACRYGPQLLAHASAMLLGIAILSASRHARQALFAAGSDRQGYAATWDRKPTDRERRLLRASFRSTMRSTAFVSLLPEVAARAYGTMH